MSNRSGRHQAHAAGDGVQTIRELIAGGHTIRGIARDIGLRHQTLVQWITRRRPVPLAQAKALKRLLARDEAVKTAVHGGRSSGAGGDAA